jgi:acyl-homoserine lactone acylase PvdQ
MIGEYLKKALKFVCSVLFFSTVILKYLYRTQMEGTVELPNAPGFVKITREEKTQIAHIVGDNIHAAFFG